jgi:hypothetical protein
MDARAFEMFVKLVGTLTKRQVSKVMSLLNDVSAEMKAAEIIDQASVANLECSRCRSAAFYRHGYAHGLQQLCAGPQLQSAFIRTPVFAGGTGF